MWSLCYAVANISIVSYRVDRMVNQRRVPIVMDRIRRPLNKIETFTMLQFEGRSSFGGCDASSSRRLFVIQT